MDRLEWGIFRPHFSPLGLYPIEERNSDISRFTPKKPVIHGKGFEILYGEKQSLNDGLNNCTVSETLSISEQ
jgi:hypothetical protein